MIALVDYGAGNVCSMLKALQAAGAEVRVACEPRVLRDADKVVLPGVGAFGDCMAGLHRAGLVSALHRAGLVSALHRAVEAGKLLLGICVGMQVLFEQGEEMGCHAGLGLLPGRVVRFPRENVASGLKVPHTGWNQIQPVAPSPLLDGLPSGAWVYFNHAYYGQAAPEHTLAVTDYGGPFASIVGRGPVYGVQFHPEKSQRAGLRILENFIHERV